MKKGIVAYIGTRFSIPKHDIPMGTKVVLDKMLNNTRAVSKISFNVIECEQFPELVGKTICSSLVKDRNQIKSMFETINENCSTSNKKLLLIL